MSSEPVRRPNELSEPVRRPNELKTDDREANRLHAEWAHGSPPNAFFKFDVFFIMFSVFFSGFVAFFVRLGLGSGGAVGMAAAGIPCEGPCGTISMACRAGAFF